MVTECWSSAVTDTSHCMLAELQALPCIYFTKMFLFCSKEHLIAGKCGVEPVVR